MLMIFEVKRRDKSYFYTRESEHLGKVGVGVASLGLPQLNSDSSKRLVGSYNQTSRWIEVELDLDISEM